MKWSKSVTSPHPLYCLANLPVSKTHSPLPGHISRAPAWIFSRQLMAEVNPQPAATASSGTFDQVQSQVNEVKVILKDNINKVLERGDKIDDLIGKTDDLQASADSFQRTSTRVARKYWWKNIKMMIIIGVIVLIVVILIILAATGVI
ncbi:vesicle-associated membrane protein 8 [Poecilia latipinna]|uniref:Si:ch73-234b20.5 n=4 Tax=Poecilia TaxID=8080 RepID=A0A096LUT8_POEFO|nr:PREDICTED: vesicle-associated membrane protein 8-like [Poecilia mexicana]XP_014913571.1 PREDICTED: vesicle-associated membrane protein 8-like [Poecilia latipinna]XP_016536582.1 PREDICTED: vesicle-associated membrane protein 8-like [Poecilia formosa]